MKNQRQEIRSQIAQVSVCDINILYKQKMVKTLRNRKINEDLYQETDTLEQNLLIQHKLKQKGIRQLLIKKNSKVLQNHLKKNQKFKVHLNNGAINQIICESSLQCAICLQLIVSPMMMLCGHMFCLKCLQSSTAYSQKCCLCRKNQERQPFVQNSLVEKIIHKFLLPSSNSLLSYLCRITESEEWNKRRRLTYIRINQIVDFQDVSSTWRRGVVSEIFPQNGQLMAKININNDGVDLEEVVQVNSCRLAPYSFFTRKRYLEEFRSFLPEPNAADKQLLQLQYRQFRDVEIDNQWRFENTDQISEININPNPIFSHMDLNQIIQNLDQQVDHSIDLLY